MKPLARTGLIERPVGDEVIVYDASTHRAHCLNRTAAVVFRAADGRTTVAAIAEAIGAAAGAEVSEKIVWTALEQLAEAKLLEGSWPARPAAPSRREAMRRVGLAAILAPAVLSLVVPTPAEAANTCIQQAACTTTNFGQPCYVVSQAECASKICTGTAAQCQ